MWQYKHGCPKWKWLIGKTEIAKWSSKPQLHGTWVKTRRSQRHNRKWVTSGSNKSIWSERSNFDVSVRQPIISGYFQQSPVKCVLNISLPGLSVASEHCYVFMYQAEEPSNSFSSLPIIAWRRLIKAHLISFWSSTALSGLIFSHCKNEMPYLYVVNSPIKSAKLRAA